VRIEVIGDATLYHADARDVLRHLALSTPPEARARALVSDPPYKVTSGGKTSLLGGWIGSEEYNNSGAPVLCDIDWSDWLPLVPDALADQAHVYIFTNDRNEPDARAAAETAGLDFHRLLIWDKVAAPPNRWYQQTCEFVVFLKKGKAYRIANPSTKSLQSLFQRDESNHPTEKPVELCRLYIENSTKPGELVLDPFAGSGTTGVAALQSGRRFVGCELDPKWFDVAVDRLRRALDQVQVIAPEAPLAHGQAGSLF
jgi:site-specific DNA-methyltransferase (adenine-specific)